ncbi:MAG: hypothetical protein ACLFN3_05195 [Halochromatium sp.]
MKTLDYRMTFNTPAFLGNAEQNGQWRTPPFKALLRQWWRIAYASERDWKLAVNDMRDEEGRLFGVASDQRRGSQKSALRLRLDRWDLGRQREWPSLTKLHHCEVNFPVDSGLYLGFGPVLLPRGSRQPALKQNAAVQADESATLSLAFPETAESSMLSAISLIDRYGTIGGRSRNGWGSCSLRGIDADALPITTRLSESFLRPWQDALSLDWPHAIGSDDRGPLIWQTNQVFNDWQGVMPVLAKLKIELRTQFQFTSGHGAPRPEDRHWLSYPVTRHSVHAWDRKARLPNSLRFKVRTEPDGRLRGLIVHIPCSPPAYIFHPNRRVLESVWSRVHAYLDQAHALTRTPE